MSTTEASLHEIREIIASVGWMNTVTNLKAFSPRIVRNVLQICLDMVMES
ncbi:unnamed protein product [Brassica oleracea var. botrytis]